MMIRLAETSFSFAYPEVLSLLLLIPLLAIARARSGNEGAVRFSSLHILNRLGPIARARAGGFRLVSLFLSLACLIVALARPQKTDTTETISESGVELILALDVSRSMQVEDFTIDGRKANRLEAAKKVTRDFIKERPNDRIGLLAFAGRPYLASPITLSKEWLEGPTGLGRIQIGLVEDGTAIGSAIAAGARRLDKRSSKSKILVLLTDGVNNAGRLSPIEAAKLAKTIGVRIYTIAVGTYGDYVVQTPIGPQRLRQEFDEKTLKEIARIADGEYFRAQDTTGLERIFASIDQMEKSEVHQRTHVEREERYHWFAFAGLALGFLTMFGNETFWRRYP